jgi:oxygen-dependent protoporphyrinogen oxidase
MKKSTVYIVGGGFSGLTLGFRLIQKGFSVQIFEQNAQPGGLIQSIPLGSDFAETAAPSVTRTIAVKKLCDDLGIDFILPKKLSKKRWIFRGRPQKWPLGIMETVVFVYRFVSARFKKQLQPLSEETLNQWGSRVLGPAASHYLLETALQGIYAGDGQRLSASLLLSQLFNPRREKFKGVLGFKNGMGSLINSMETKIIALGGKLHYSASVNLTQLELLQAKNPGPIVVATSADAAALFLETRFETLSRLLRKIEMMPLVAATVFFPEEKNLTHGFGCLIPRNLGLNVLGVLINSDIFNKPDGLRSETWIIGGATNKTFIKYSDQEIIEIILRERLQIFKSHAKIQNIKIVRWPKALPHYDTELEKLLPLLEEAEKVLETRQIYLHGNYLGALGLSKILDRTEKLCKDLDGLYG